MSDLATVVNRHIGRPWSAQGFDCWAFVRAVYADAYGIVLPVLPGVDGSDHRAAARAVVETQAAGDWRPIAQPVDGAAVLMGKRDRPHHCGVWLAISGGLIAHCDASGGVRCHNLISLAGLGWGSFTYYQHRLRP